MEFKECVKTTSFGLQMVSILVGSVYALIEYLNLFIYNIKPSFV